MDIIATVREHIEILVIEDRLQKEDCTLRDKFSNCFPDDIPHIADLPTNVYHRFRLKDANMTISHCQYECLKKYREVWRTLLQ